MMLSHSIKLTYIGPVIRHVRSISLTFGQFYPRNFHKSPEEVENQELDTIAEIESNLFDARSPVAVGKQSHPTKTNGLLKSYRNPKNPMPAKSADHSDTGKSSVPSTQKLIDPDLNLSYDKLGRNDGRLSSLLLVANSRKARNKRQQIIIEGRRLILDAIKARLHLNTVIFAQKDHLAEIKDEIRQLKNIEIVRVPQQDLRSWSTLTTCPGIIAIFQRPSDELVQRDSARLLPITVICDNVREPNNLGSIIRTCAAIPCDEIILTKGCCDPWDTKALRGGCGAQFYIRIRDDFTWNQIAETYQRSLSNENRASNSNSGSILVYLAENNVENSQRFNVPVLPYTEIQIDENVERCILVIGGETHGISEDAYRFSKYCSENLSNESSGCLHIPISSNIDSLNTASALTLLLFELRKRLMERQTQDNEISNVNDTMLF